MKTVMICVYKLHVNRRCWISLPRTARCVLCLFRGSQGVHVPVGSGGRANSVFPGLMRVSSLTRECLCKTRGMRQTHANKRVICLLEHAASKLQVQKPTTFVRVHSCACAWLMELRLAATLLLPQLIHSKVPAPKLVVPNSCQCCAVVLCFSYPMLMGQLWSWNSAGRGEALSFSAGNDSACRAWHDFIRLAWACKLAEGSKLNPWFKFLVKRFPACIVNKRSGGAVQPSTCQTRFGLAAFFVLTSRLHCIDMRIFLDFLNVDMHNKPGGNTGFRPHGPNAQRGLGRD